MSHSAFRLTGFLPTLILPSANRSATISKHAQPLTARTPTRAAFLLALAATAARAQTTDPAIAPSVSPKAVRRHTPRQPAAPAGPNLDLVLLDPAHGGMDSGAHLGPNLVEKDVNLAFAQRLRGVLAARGFTVVLTRENDPTPQPATPGPDPTQPPIPAPPPPQVTPDARAELANRSHPLACLLLHATAAGRGVHLYTSALAPVSNPYGQPLAPDQRPIQLWDTAQAAFLRESARLAGDLAQAIRNLSLPLLTGTASVSPADSMACAAVAIEVAPLQPNGGSVTPSSDAAYQSRLANAIVEALLLYRSQAVAAQPVPAPPAAVPPAVKPKPRPRPRPVDPDGLPAPALRKSAAPPADPSGDTQ